MVNFFAWIVYHSTVLLRIKASQPQLPASPLLPDPDPEPEKKPYRSFTPLSSGQEMLSFHPALADAIGQNKAIILQKILDWMEFNQSINKAGHFIDGEWYTYDSASGWQQRHFWFIAVSTVKRLFQELERDGFIKRTQHHMEWGDHRQWVTIPDESRARIDALCAVHSPAQKNPGGAQKNPLAESRKPPPGAKESPTKSQSTNEKHQIKKPKREKQQQQPITLYESEIPTELDDVAVVADPSGQQPESISGEHSFDGEGSASVVKAQHRDGTNDAPISPVPPPPLSQGEPLTETAQALIDEMLHVYGSQLVAGHGVNLIRQYGEDMVRSVHWYTVSRKNLYNPVGYLTDELHKRKLNLRPLSADAGNPYLPDEPETASLSSLIDDDQFARLDLQRLQELETREHIPPLPEPVGLDEKPAGSMTAREIWETAKHQLSLLFDQFSFSIWLKHAEPLGYDPSTATYRIAVPSAQAQDNLQHRYYRKIQRVFEGLSAKPVNIVFEVAPQPDLPHSPLTPQERGELAQLRAQYCAERQPA